VSATNTLKLGHSEVVNNQAGAGNGGGLLIAGTADISQSTIDGNVVSGPAAQGGGIFADGPLTITNSTITFNQTSGGEGGAIFVNSGTTSLIHTTVAVNKNDNEGQLANGATLFIQNSIVSNPVGVNSNNCTGAITSISHSLEDGATCGFGADPASLQNVDPLLGQLSLNGGPTPTLALAAGSPAIGTALKCCGITTDQRGAARPDAVSPQNPDMGAFERPPATTTALTALPASPSQVNQNVTFTATITGNAPGGTVNFTEAGASLCGLVPLAGNVAQCITTFNVGPHTIVAIYSGDLQNAGSQATLVQTVNQATSTVTLNIPPVENPANFGTTVHILATVAGATPAGNVTFKDGNTVLCSIALDVNSQAICTTTLLAPGQHQINVDYAGDANNTVSTATTQETINPAPTTVAVASSANPSNLNVAVTFTATVTGQNPTGNVTFRDGNTPICANVVLNGLFKAACMTAQLTAGIHQISADYNGDVDNAASSTAPALAQNVVMPGQNVTTTAVAAMPNPSMSGAQVTFTATINNAANGAGGTVNFTADGTAICTAVAITAAVPPTAPCPISTLSPGNHNIVASYTGDAGNSASVSQGFQQTVNAAPAFVTGVGPFPETVGVPFALAVTASGFPPPQVTTGLAPLPAWLSLVNGSLTGTPPAAGDTMVTLNAINGVGATAILTLTLHVTSAPVATVSFISGPAGDGIVGVPYSAQVQLVPAGAALKVSAGKLPPGLTLSGGTVSGTPTLAGTFVGTFNGSNGIGIDATQTFSITIAPLHQGIWWGGGKENGWGLSLFEHGNSITAGWYYFGSDGQPEWLIMPNCNWTGESCAGDVFASTSAWFGQYDAASFKQSKAGAFTFEFAKNTPDGATFSYDVNGVKGSKSLTRFALGGAGNQIGSNYTGIWWAGQPENGWGVALFQQGNDMAGSWYTYDAAGQTSWFVIHGGNWMDANTCVAALLRGTGAPVIGTSYDASKFSGSDAGKIVFKFSDTKSGTMTYSVDGIEQTKKISKFVF